MAGEDKIYNAGTKLLTLEINGWKIRPFVCYDLRFRFGPEINMMLYMVGL